MYCMQCGKELPEGSKFCLFCGASLPQGTAGQQPPRQAQPEWQQPQPAPTAPSAPAGQGTAPAGEKKSKGVWSYWIMAAICVALSIININDMRAEDGIISYMVWFGIPVQFILFPLAAIFVGIGIRNAFRGSDS